MSQALTAPRAADRPAVAFISHARLISALTLVCRVLGLVREMALAWVFGAGMVTDAFIFAFKIPNLFRKLLGEGALSLSFIPLYAQTLKSDPATAKKFAAASVQLLAVILLSLTILGEAVLWAAGHFIPAEPRNLLILKFTAIMLPYVMLICGTAFLSGILQVHRRFAMPALTPAVLNTVHIAVVVTGASILGLRGAQGASKLALQATLAYWLSFFVLVAGVLQIAMLLPSLRACGFDWKVGWSDAADTARQAIRALLGKMLRMSGPVALGAAVLQGSVLLDAAITVALTGSAGVSGATLLGHAVHLPLQSGAVTRLNWAQFLYQFPLGVFAIALATAIFPGLSADALDHDREHFRRTLRQGILLALWEGLPASAGLVLIRVPAVRVLFERGDFTAADTHWVALSLAFYASAVWAFSVQQILNRAYYALHDTLTPLLLSVATLVINTLVEIPMCFTRLGEAGIAVGTLVSFSLQALVMLWLLDRRIGNLGLSRIAASAAKMLLATGLMCAACLAVEMTPIYPVAQSHLASLVQLMILIPVGAATYLGACYVLGRGRVLMNDDNPMTMVG